MDVLMTELHMTVKPLWIQNVLTSIYITQTCPSAAEEVKRGLWRSEGKGDKRGQEPDTALILFHRTQTAQCEEESDSVSHPPAGLHSVTATNDNISAVFIPDAQTHSGRAFQIVPCFHFMLSQLTATCPHISPPQSKPQSGSCSSVGGNVP